jgi:uncharacterized protein YjeT (DUF2065 family)
LRRLPGAAIQGRQFAMWHDFWVALALMMVIEGVWPFLSPAGFRRTLALVMQQDDRSLRVMGFVSMMAGVVFLYWVN